MRKRKLHFDSMVNIFEYFSFQRGVHTSGVRGTYYFCAKPLTDEQREQLAKYNNVEVGTVHYKYAPEIVHDTVFVADKCF